MQFLAHISFRRRVVFASLTSSQRNSACLFYLTAPTITYVIFTTNTVPFKRKAVAKMSRLLIIETHAHGRRHDNVQMVTLPNSATSERKPADCKKCKRVCKNDSHSSEVAFERICARSSSRHARRVHRSGRDARGRSKLALDICKINPSQMPFVPLTSMLPRTTFARIDRIQIATKNDRNARLRERK